MEMNLVFVYNADSGVFNMLSDIAHKIFSPDTYQCNLCNLTHGYFQERDEWMGFLKDLDAEIEFLHRDEYIKNYVTRGQDLNVDLPAIFIKSDDGLKLWIEKKTINELKSTDDLMEMIRAGILRKQAGVKDEDEFLSMPV